MSNLTHEITFPVITKIVKQAKGKTVTTDEIAAKLIGDNQVGAVLRQTAKERGESWDNTAINAVAWFSQRYTTGKNEYANVLGRTKVGGKYAYNWVG